MDGETLHSLYRQNSEFGGKKVRVEIEQYELIPCQQSIQFTTIDFALFRGAGKAPRRMRSPERLTRCNESKPLLHLVKEQACWQNRRCCGGDAT